ncbi:MAG: 16S rRNA (uracil(1498)-N(3))-methyltransferase [Betaproteobacteria bacterium]|nr:16S rRNA (uracil(1498)-N(3))-methyltransferase [Betaproteobacteria bacterium]
MPGTKPPARIFVHGHLGAGGKCALPPAQARHVARALRLRPGDAVTLFNGDGNEYGAEIERIGKDAATLNVTGGRAVDREAPFAVTLAQAVSSGERMDYTVQKAVELGVAGIQPLVSARNVVRLREERAVKRLAHWQAVVIAACEQCGRNRVPPVEPPLEFHAWLALTAKAQDGAAKLLLSPRAADSLHRLARPAAGVILLAGPEGGLAPEEERAAEQTGFHPVRLGPRVLRTETAAVAALAALQALWGDF